MGQEKSVKLSKSNKQILKDAYFDDFTLSSTSINYLRFLLLGCNDNDFANSCVFLVYYQMC